MPDFDDIPHDGFGPGEDFGHSHDDGLGHSHQVFGHGGFFNPNHFDDDRFFVKNAPAKGGGKPLFNALTYIVYVGGMILLGLISYFVIFGK